jgi:alpha-glucosidase
MIRGRLKLRAGQPLRACRKLLLASCLLAACSSSPAKEGQGNGGVANGGGSSASSSSGGSGNGGSASGSDNGNTGNNGNGGSSGGGNDPSTGSSTGSEPDTDAGVGVSGPMSGPGTYQIGPFVIVVADTGAVAIHHVDAPDRKLFETVASLGFAEAWAATDTIKESRGSLKITEMVTKRCGAEGMISASRTDSTVTLAQPFATAGCEGAGAELTFHLVSQRALGFTLRATGTSFQPTRVVLVAKADAGEGFYGFGEQFTYLDLRGRDVPVVVQEQGIGRGDNEVGNLLKLAAPDSVGDWSTTYDAMPYYFSSKLRSMLLENAEISWFDLTAQDRIKVRLRGTEMRGQLLFGQAPKDIIRALTDYSGRMQPLPDWANQGAIIGMQGGTARVREVLAQLDEYQTPIGGFWLQDWMGKRNTGVASQLWWNWQLNTSHYPEFTQLVADLKARGARVLTYVNPFLVDVAGQAQFTRNLFEEAKTAGYLVKDAMGMPMMIAQTTFSAGIVDLTNPEAVNWLKKVIVDQVLSTGAVGYMADFGEALPFEAVLASKEAAATYHNRYPEVWQELNRRVFEENNLLGEGLFFTRSGFTKSPGLSTLFWLGDQTITWDGNDGLQSSIAGLLSGGLSGISLNHSDIGGYTAAPLITRSEELLMRWCEMNAFTAVYRTHEGTDPTGNAQFYDNATTLAHFARFAKFYAALAPYRETLMKEASETGTPLVRHMLLEYPNDPAAWTQTLQFMLGPDVLVVPVSTKGGKSVRAYIPAGEWVHLFTDQAYNAVGTVDVEAPMGQPAVFYRKGSAAGEALKAVR